MSCKDVDNDLVLIGSASKDEEDFATIRRPFMTLPLR